MRHLPVFGLCLALALAAGAAAAQDEGEAQTTVGLDVKDTSLGDVLMLLHWQTGASFAAELPPAEAPKVTLTVDDVSLEDALDLVVKPVGYRWERVGSLYAVGPPPQPIEMASVAEEESYLLFPFRARLDVARLLAGLSATQWDALAAHGNLTWADLTPDQHDALAALYGALGAYWVKSAQVDPDSLPRALRGARLEPADHLSLGLRTWTWALQ
jgi:hypothetical protein